MNKMLYCVKHGTMERAELARYSPSTMIHMVWDANYPDDLDWCEFPQGWESCPPPEPPFDIQIDGSVLAEEPPYFMDEYYFNYQYDPNTDSITHEMRAQ